jgi:hypothetical protein
VALEDIKPYQWKKGQSGNPQGGKIHNPEVKAIKHLTVNELVEVGSILLKSDFETLIKLVTDNKASIIQRMCAAMAIETIESRNPSAFNALLDRLVGKPKSEININMVPNTEQENKILTFSEFCENAGYPKPFEKQIEMKDFCLHSFGPRLLLGARGYGKTDYITILGLAYEIYLNPLKRKYLIMTKSREKNSALLNEIAGACEKAGVAFEKKNSTCIRAGGLLGKDHSVSAVTVKSVSLRGRHPDLIICDDIITPEDVSEATRLHVERIYFELNKLSPQIALIGQPVHKYDLYETLRPLLKKLEVPYGQIPELDADLDAQRLAGVSEDSIQKSYYLVVGTDEATPFDKVKYLDRFPVGDAAVAFIDPSFEGGDFTALTIMKAYMEGIAVVGFVYKKAWNHCIDEISKQITRFNVKRLAFETNCLGDQPIELLRKSFNIGVVGRKSNTNKHSRIMSAGMFAHMIHISKESDKLYIEHVVKYEYKSKYDDAPDSLASCLSWLGLIRGKQ